MKRKKNKKLVKNEKLYAGWLSPSGEYFRLESHHLCHEDLAQEILIGEDYFEESELAKNKKSEKKEKHYCSSCGKECVKTYSNINDIYKHKYYCEKCAKKKYGMFEIDG